MTRVTFNGLPDRKGPDYYGDIRRAINNLLFGKQNVAGTFTVTAGTTETSVSDRNIGAGSFVGFTGLNGDSLTASLYLKSRDVLSRTFSVGHDNSGQTREYSYIIIG